MYHRWIENTLNWIFFPRVFQFYVAHFRYVRKRNESFINFVVVVFIYMVNVCICVCDGYLEIIWWDICIYGYGMMMILIIRFCSLETSRKRWKSHQTQHTHFLGRVFFCCWYCCLIINLLPIFSFCVFLFSHRLTSA